MSSEVCHYLNMKKKEFCLRRRLFTNTLKRKENELFKAKVQLRKDCLDGEVEMGQKKVGKG